MAKTLVKKFTDRLEVTVFFSYTASVVPPRCRNPRNVAMHDGKVTVTIPRIAKEDAPIAIIATDTMSFKSAEYPCVTKTRYKFWNKQLYREVCDGYASREPDSKLGKITVDRRCTWESYNYDSPRICDTYEAQIQSIEAFYSQFVMIGNQMAKKAPEPMYVIQTFGLGCNHGGTSLCVDNWYNSNIRWESYYRLDQLKEAMKIKDAVAKGRGDTKDIGRKPYIKFKILIPDAIQANPERDYGGKGDEFNSVETLISTFGNPNVAGMALTLMARC